MHRIKKIVVFTGSLNYAVRKGIVSIDHELPGLSWLILIHAPKYSFGQVLFNQWVNLKRHGWRRIPDVFSTAYERLRFTSYFPVSKQVPSFEYTMEYIKNRNHFQVLQYDNIHSQDAIDKITAFQPDIGLSLAAPILRNKIFNIPSFGTLNLHKGKVPEYRGMPPAFWEMWNEEEYVGCTVHWVDEKLDTGAVVVSSSVKCEKYSTVRGLRLCLDEIGNHLMCEAILKIDQGIELNMPQPVGGKTYRTPTLKQVAQLNEKINSRTLLQKTDPKKIIGDALKKSLFLFGKLIFWRYAAPRITVILYHRVTDEVRDNLTTGIEQFERQMMLLRRYFQVISLSELLKLSVIPRSSRPIVCVTFDDGYLDNYTNAFPILIRHNIPASFFVSTGLIGTTKQFPHDVRRGNQFIPLMDWSHLKEMYKAGFAIGSHTVSHINCASEEEAVVRAELVQSLQDIKQKIGLTEVVLAYPYGGKQHMTQKRLAIVKEVGYTGCLSAYGGINIEKVDRFNVLRRGIYWEFSDTSFLYAVQGLF